MKITKILFVLIVSVFCIKESTYAEIEWEEIENYIANYSESNVVEVLLKYKISDQALNHAMVAKDYFSVVMLVEYGFDINFRTGGIPSSPLHKYFLTIIELAIEANEINLVEYFLAKNANPISQFQYKELDQSITFKTAVYDAIFLNRLDIIKLFAEYGVDLNKICYMTSSIVGSSRQSIRQSPLQTAVAYKRKEIAQFLLSIGVDI